MNNNENILNIRKGEILNIKGKKLTLMEDKEIHPGDNGYFILNLWEQCDIADIEVFPADYVVCQKETEEYVLFQDNIILGAGEDLCLN